MTQGRVRAAFDPVVSVDDRGMVPPDLRIAGILVDGILEGMKTTIDIPDRALEDAMRYTGAKTKREAVVKALEDYNRQQRVKEVVAGFGTLDFFSNDEIEAADLEAIAERESRKAGK